MTCSICLGILHQPVTMDCCKNKYCYDCITQWKQVRSVCPLCCAPTGQSEVNKLKKLPSMEHFDDGSLILETEISDIKSRIIYVRQRIYNKRQQYKKFKCMVSSSLMAYLEKELERIQIYRDCMEEQFLLTNRIRTVQYMQLIAEAMLQLENALDTNTIYEDEYTDEEEFEYEDEMLDEEYDGYDDYEINYQKRQAKTKKSKQNSNQSGEQKNKSVKLN